jgi:hypothetical protein
MLYTLVFLAIKFSPGMKTCRIIRREQMLLLLKTQYPPETFAPEIAGLTCNLMRH